MKLSVITVNRNNREGLRKTLESIAAQTVHPFECIVVDGASTDGGAELLKTFAGIITWSVSEPDKGIYNAMNKGISHAGGEWCLFMNSGDCFASDKVLAALEEIGPTADIIAGDTLVLTDPPHQKTAPEHISLRFLFNESLCHQSVLIKTALLRKYPYDESLKIVSDRKFFLQALVFDNASYQAVPVEIAAYDVSGYSAQNRFASEQEWQSALEQLIPPRILLDYGQESKGALYGASAYEKLFLEIGRRRYRGPVYRLVRRFLRLCSCFAKSANFVKSFPRNP